MLQIMIDGVPVARGDAVISVLDHGFLFGHSLYEVVKTKHGRLFAPNMHLTRLRYSAENLNIPIPWSNDYLLAEMNAMVKAVAAPECYLRIIVTGGEGPLKMDHSQCTNPKRILFGKPHESYPQALYQNGATVKVSEYRKISMHLDKGNIKAGHHPSNVMAIKDALGEGFHEALLLNPEDHIAECTTSNIFWIKDQIVYTPSLGVGILNGITRQILFHIFQRQGIPFQEGFFILDQLLEADEVFISSTTRDILPVRSIDDQLFTVIGPLTQKIMNAFDDFDDKNLK